MKKKLLVVATALVLTVALTLGAAGTVLAFLKEQTEGLINLFEAKEIVGVTLMPGRQVRSAMVGDTERTYGGWGTENTTVKHVIFGSKADYLSVIDENTKIHVGDTENDKVYAYNGNQETVYILTDDEDVIITLNLDGGRIFQNMKALETIDLSPNFRLPATGDAYGTTNQNNTTSISWHGLSLLAMFQNCVNLTNIKNVSKQTFNTVNCTWFQEMFSNCEKLPTDVMQTVVNAMDVTNADQTHTMFQKCLTVTSLDISHFKSAKNRDVQFMFDGCENLANLNIVFGEGNFDTSNVSYFSGMFRGCKSLTTEQFKKILGAATADTGDDINTSNGIVLAEMFSWCTTVTELDVSMFNTEKVGTTTVIGESEPKYSNCFYSMFAYCDNLENIVGLDSFNVINAHSFGRMFEKCPKLQTVDLSSFDMKDLGTPDVRCPKLEGDRGSSGDKYVELMMSIFDGCSSLTTIYANETWEGFYERVKANLDLGANEYTVDMFNGCTQLIGGNRTVYDPDKVDGEYARIDSATNGMGYFTLKPAA